MGHLASKDIYHDLSKKIGGVGISLKAVKNEKFYKILKELYTEEEAAFVVKMPYGLSTLVDLVEKMSMDEVTIKKMLNDLCPKGLVMDLAGQYSPSPFVVGFFEFSLMRKGDSLPFDKWASLFITLINRVNRAFLYTH
jgi:hypothetical protein